MKRACAAVGLSRATAYRKQSSSHQPPSAAKHVSAGRIPDAERSKIHETLDSQRFIDQPPPNAYAALLSEGTFMCSWRTMCRVLSERALVRERQNQREAKSHAVPRLIAAAPNQAWSWDIRSSPRMSAVCS